MKVRLLRPALEDLAAGRRFYDRQQAGVGGYFFDSLFGTRRHLAEIVRFIYPPTNLGARHVVRESR